MRQNRAIVATVGRVRILVVEDNPDSREIYEDTLRAAGYEVVTATTLAAGEHASHVQKPDLAILDCRLPDGCGIDLLRRWKSSATMASVPIVMVTAHSASEYIRAASSAGADAFLVKPCWDDLTPFVARIVQGAQSSHPGIVPQNTTKRPRYRMAKPQAAKLSLVPAPLFDDNEGKLLVRCQRCFRSSPALGRSQLEANVRATALGWAVKAKGWTCPVCIERYEV